MPSPTPDIQLREPSPSEGVDGVEFGAQFTRADAITALSNQTASAGGASIRAQVELLAYMRRKRLVIVQPIEAHETLNLVWRLVLATSFATAVLTAGVILTAVALWGEPLDPNPLAALSVLFCGVVLTLTLVAVLRED